MMTFLQVFLIVFAHLQPIAEVSVDDAETIIKLFIEKFFGIMISYS